MSSRFLATLIGLIAIGFWAVLALLTAATGTIPPFQLLAMTFATGAAIGVVSWIFRPGAIKALRQPWPVWLLGVGGLFGYHAVYYAALRKAPPAEASLIAYLWPLLIVLFAACLPGEHLRWRHLGGAVLGLGGTALLLAKKLLAVQSGGAFDGNVWGYVAAFGCAFTWSGYSVLNRRFSATPSDTRRSPKRTT